MKKTYIKPATDVVAIDTEAMMVGSYNGISIVNENGGNSILNTTGYATGSAMSKDNAFDLWGEDEE